MSSTAVNHWLVRGTWARCRRPRSITGWYEGPGPGVVDRSQSLAGTRDRSNDTGEVEGRRQAVLIKFKVIRITAVARYTDLICIIYANKVIKKMKNEKMKKTPAMCNQWLVKRVRNVLRSRKQCMQLLQLLHALCSTSHCIIILLFIIVRGRQNCRSVNTIGNKVISQLQIN